jgi:signal transduction histidine kinase
LLKKIVTIQEDERGRIARDLHDQLGQRLTALRLKIAALKDVDPANAVIGQRITRLQEISEGIDNEVSYLAWELRPTILEDAGLVVALGQHLKEWSRHSGIPAEFSPFGLRDHVISPDLETNLYRITQEALNNAAKHSKAGRVNVLLERRGDELILIIEDDGVGFDAGTASSNERTGRGFGLASMRDRADVIGASLEIESGPGKGTTIFVRVSVD